MSRWGEDPWAQWPLIYHIIWKKVWGKKRDRDGGGRWKGIVKMELKETEGETEGEREWKETEERGVNKSS